VFHQEPLPEGNPFWVHPKVTVTPHIAAITEPRVAAQHVVDNIRRMERGEKLENVVDLKRGY
jgi:glyoxylate/hydroxypyruvate reductase A